MSVTLINYEVVLSYELHTDLSFFNLTIIVVYLFENSIKINFLLLDKNTNKLLFFDEVKFIIQYLYAFKVIIFSIFLVFYLKQKD